jgi:3-oxoacyl-[acyl-carrier-protein] synthase II
MKPSAHERPPEQRVVVTGIGLRTPLGHQIEPLFDALLTSKSAVRAFPEWRDVVEMGSFVGAPIADFNGREIPRKMRRTMGRLAQFAAAAATDAVADADLSSELLGSGRVGVAVGSTLGSSAALEDFWRAYILEGNTRRLKGGLFFQVMSHSAATNVALLLGVTGEALACNAACASATQAIVLATERIRGGRADIMLAGGADELHPAATLTFDSVGGASTNYNDAPHQTPRPFDRDRDGVVVAEGAGIVVLESLAHARARGVKILAEVLGGATSCDARHMASPSPEGMASCMRLGLRYANLGPGDIHYVNAHATGTRVGDASEAEALNQLFGDRVPVSSIKGHLGHMQGACGAVEVAVCIEAMKRGVVPHTMNLENPDVAVLDLPTAPREKTIDAALTTNFAFGGVNTCLVLGSPPS